MSTRYSLIFSFIDRYASLVITVVSSMVIARLLTPAEIGVFSVTMVLLIFVNTVRDMNAGQYMVQEKNLTTDSIRAVWALQLGLGFGLAILVLAASHPVAVFYSEPRMRGIMWVVALNYAVNPLGSLTSAWLVREMKFGSLAMMRFASGLAGALVSTGMAWKGYGPISLAFGSLCATLVNAIVATFYRPKSFPWLPGLAEIKTVLSFGTKLTGSSFISQLALNAPELVLGKIQNVAAVGYFSRANGLVQMFYRLFVDAALNVCMPWFAKCLREDGEVNAPYLKATAYLTVFGWPFCVGLACLAHPAITLLYGNQWGSSVDLTRILAIATAISVPASLSRTALLAGGCVNTVVKVTILTALPTIAFVIVGAFWGLNEVGVLLVLASIINSWLWLRAVARDLGIRWRAILAVFWLSAKVTALSAIGPTVAWLIYGARPEQVLASLGVGSGLGIVGFLAGTFIFDHPVKYEITRIIAKIR